MKTCARAPEVAGSRESAAVATPRVCLLTETFYPVVGGGETHARLLAKHLNALGLSTFVLTRRSDRRSPRLESVDGVPTYRIRPSGMKRFGKYAMVPFALLELFRRRRDYDLILVCGFRVLGAPAVVAARLLGKACVLRAEAEGEVSGGYASAYRKLPAAAGLPFRAWIGLRNRLLSRADAFVSISAPIAEEFVRWGVPADRVLRLPNGIDTGSYGPVDGECRAAVRANLGLPARDAVAVYSGKLNQGKGLEYLLRAWHRVVASGRDARLVLVGSGGGQSLSCEDELRRLTSELQLDSCVVFTGYVENVHEYLQAADLFVLPSESEGLPMSLLEAMSCRLPVIASRVGGIPEAVEHRVNGILVRPGDSDELAREIIGLLDEPSLAESLAANARETVRQRYAIEVVSARYYGLLSAVHARKHGAAPSPGREQ